MRRDRSHRRRRWQEAPQSRVFWVGFSLAIVGLVLYLAQDPETLHVESPVAAADSRFPDYVASLVGAPVARGRCLHRAAQRRRGVSRHAGRDRQRARRASTSKPTCSTTARSPIASSMPWRAPPSAASSSASSSIRSVRRSSRRAPTIESRRREARLVQSPRLLQPRGLQLPDPSQDARRRRRRRVHRRHGRRRPLARPRAGQGALARYAFQGHRSRRPRARRRRSTRTGSKPAGYRRRRSIPNCRRGRPAPARSWCGAIR